MAHSKNSWQYAKRRNQAQRDVRMNTELEELPRATPSKQVSKKQRQMMERADIIKDKYDPLMSIAPDAVHSGEEYMSVSPDYEEDERADFARRKELQPDFSSLPTELEELEQLSQYEADAPPSAILQQRRQQYSNLPTELEEPSSLAGLSAAMRSNSGSPQQISDANNAEMGNMRAAWLAQRVKLHKLGIDTANPKIYDALEQDFYDKYSKGQR